MVLPVRENPSALAQGALAIECRASDARVRSLGLLPCMTPRRSAESAPSGSFWPTAVAAAIKDSARPRSLRRRAPTTSLIRGVKPDASFVEELR